MPDTMHFTEVEKIASFCMAGPVIYVHVSEKPNIYHQYIIHVCTQYSVTHVNSRVDPY